MNQKPVAAETPPDAGRPATPEEQKHLDECKEAEMEAAKEALAAARAQRGENAPTRAPDAPDAQGRAPRKDAPTALLRALLAAQAKFETVRKNGENPHFRAKYATLDEIWETVRKPIADAGLVVYCTIERDTDGKQTLTTHVAHAATGEELSCSFPIAPASNAPQAIGSALTYARRYTLSTLLEIVTRDGSDDDGNAAQGNPAPADIGF